MMPNIFIKQNLNTRMPFRESLKIQQNWTIHCLFVALCLFLLPLQNASATPAFSRQTGEPCTTCHMQAYGPWLTQYGIKFKLDGYTAGNANTLPDALNAFSLEINGSVTNLAKNVPPGQLYGVGSSGQPLNTGQSAPNNNAMLDWVGLYYTGRVTDNIGSYMQLNVNPKAGHSVSLAMADIRFANHLRYQEHDVTYGISLNNAPTMSDFWETTYAWMYPYMQSSTAIMPTAQPWMASLMKWANLAGATAYTMIDNHLYLEAGAYTSQSRYMAQGLGVWDPGSNSSAPFAGLLDGGAPYWRMFYQHTTGPHTMMIGTFGMMANVIPYYQRGYGKDSYEEYNVDTNYTYMMNDNNMLMFMAKYTRDNMKMGASYNMQASTNAYNYLNSWMAMGMWTYKQTYNLQIGWMNTSGSADMNLYNGAGQNVGNGPVSGPSAYNGSANGSPNWNAYLFELDWIPFGKGTMVSDPYMNLRLSAQYWAYTQFNGAKTNYDGAGRSPEANNTLYFVGNLMF